MKKDEILKPQIWSDITEADQSSGCFTRELLYLLFEYADALVQMLHPFKHGVLVGEHLVGATAAAAVFSEGAVAVPGGTGQFISQSN